VLLLSRPRADSELTARNSAYVLTAIGYDCDRFVGFFRIRWVHTAAFREARAFARAFRVGGLGNSSRLERLTVGAPDRVK